MPYSAIYLAYDEIRGDISKKGFSSRKKAEKYVEKHACKHCIKELEQGFMDLGGGCRPKIDSIMQTGCGCEWEIKKE